ncbi:hypothetical protein QFC21_003670 [Naganishia friedmannii]|uniref:Uncharacterized protein n=1 Tax=Naganishia friedmannii TaxID=89922 RepID=A0ACC2VNE2_9TREE|nr:hypothetical protein QFC21_003670 [Naganishia friedmannii]
MPRLQILQHKSYHPYLETNKQRVRDDEAKAAALEAEEERTALNQACRSSILPHYGTSVDSSALLAAQRSEKIKAERRDEKKRLEYDWPKEEEKKRNRERRKESASGNASLERKQDKAAAGGHINFWDGLEKPGKPKKTPDEIQADDPTTMYLDRPLRETKPWYTDALLRGYDEREDDAERREKRDRAKYVSCESRPTSSQSILADHLPFAVYITLRRKEEDRKRGDDPMTHVQAALSSTDTRAQPRQQQNRYHQASRPSIPGNMDPLLAARTSRESAERARALALISSARRQADSVSVGTIDAEWTPARSTRTADEEGDLWNPKEVREARRRREAVRGWRNGV